MTGRERRLGAEDCVRAYLLSNQLKNKHVI